MTKGSDGHWWLIAMNDQLSKIADDQVAVVLHDGRSLTTMKPPSKIHDGQNKATSICTPFNAIYILCAEVFSIFWRVHDSL